MRLFWRKALELYVFMAILFFLHRASSFFYLQPDHKWSLWQTCSASFVGLLSDIWVAALISLTYLLAGSVAWLLTSSRRILPWLAALFMVFFGALTIIHQPYVEFFGYQIIPFHLTYLTDTDFIAANYRSMFNFWVLALLAVTIFFSWDLRQGKSRPIIRAEAGVIPLVSLYVVAFLIALAFHSMNIHYRVQLFIPDELQSNFIENLYRKHTITEVPPPLLAEDRAFLANALAQPAEPKAHHEGLQPLLYRRVGTSAATPLATSIRHNLQSQIMNGDAPFVITVLLESARPADYGVFNNISLSASNTPVFDQLSTSGVLFTQAYATGTVTRGAQEAVWCGHLSGLGTSGMRERPDLQLDCLTQMIRKEQGPMQKGNSFWFHGGKGEFDNQKRYWQARGVDLLLSQEDFDNKIVKTSWGVSDLALFSRAADELATLPKTTSFRLGMILTLTNHIPWDLPGDLSSERATRRARTNQHPSYHTTAYADQALGEFIKKLKEKSLWEKTLLIVSSDHGTNVPALYPEYEKKHLRLQSDLESHIVLLLSGGITEAVLQQQNTAEGSSGRVINEVVSQAGIAPFIAYLLGLEDAAFMGEMLLGQDNRAPIGVNLVGKYYFPASGRQYRSEEILTLNPDELAISERLNLVYYRAFLRMIYEGAKRNRTIHH